jgi:hypothetical protein
MGVKGRLRKLEQSLDTETGPPPQEYYDAKARRGRYIRAMSAKFHGELPEEERGFMESYRDSPLAEDDGRLIERYQPPRSAEEEAETRKRIKEALDELASKRRQRGY